MEMCAYHHGETSLYSTTIGLAQDFVGSNNVNILYPGGSFGSRLQVSFLSPPFSFSIFILFPIPYLATYNFVDGNNINPL
jgi:hypothetical protein